MAVPRALRFFGLALLISCHASAAVLVEKLANVPKGWTLVNTPSGDSKMVLQIALAQQNLDQLESKLASVSTPGSASYGQYMDLAEVKAMFGASDASTTAVKSWLESSGITNYKTQGDSIWFQTTVSNANSMLGTTFHNFADSTGSTKLRTTQYSIPDEVAAHIDLVSPTTFFGKTRAMTPVRAQGTKALPKRQASKSKSWRKRQEPAACEGSIVSGNRTIPAFGPACLKIEYDINGYTPDPRAGSRIAFGSFLNQSASFSDIFQFEQYFQIPPQK